MNTKLLELVEAHPLYKIGENIADRYSITTNDLLESSDDLSTDNDTDMSIDLASLLQDSALIKNLQREANKLDSSIASEQLTSDKIIGIASLLLGILSRILSFKKTSGIVSILEQSLKYNPDETESKFSVREDVDLQSILIQVLPLLPLGLQGQLNAIMPFILPNNPST